MRKTIDSTYKTKSISNLFQPQAFLNGDKYIPEVFQRQGAHRYVDCLSAKILSRNNGQTIVQYDMIVIGSTGKQSRQQCIVGLLTGKGYLCLLYTSPSPRDDTLSRMPSSA